jgi:hypothetical protein
MRLIRLEIDVVDPGGILRRSLLMTGIPEPESQFLKQHPCNQSGVTLLSLSFRAALRYLESQGFKADFDEKNQVKFGLQVISQIRPYSGSYQRADTGGYQLMLRYRASKQAVEEVSLTDLLIGKVEEEQIRDRIVFIGYTTPQAKDDFYTPYSVGKEDEQKMPGVIVHAQSTSQILSAVLDDRSLIWVWSNGVEIIWIYTWAIIGGFLGWYFRHPGIFAVIFLGGAAILFGLCWLTFIQGGWVPLVPAGITLLGTAIGVILLDRFNNSAYGKQVYQKVKTFLRLEIEIDENKLQEQVSEITETDYFKDLQDKVKTLRQTVSASELSAMSSSSASQLYLSDKNVTFRPKEGQNSKPLTSVSKHTSTLSDNLLECLFSEQETTKSDVNMLVSSNPVSQSKLSETSALVSEVGTENEPSLDDYEQVFLQNLSHKVERMKSSSMPTSHDDTVQNSEGFSYPPGNGKLLGPIDFDRSNTNQSDRPAYRELFQVEPQFCACCDRSDITQAYLTLLDKQASVLRQVSQLELPKSDS